MTTRLHLSQIPESATESDIKTLISKIAQVEEVYYPRDTTLTGIKRDFAIIKVKGRKEKEGIQCIRTLHNTLWKNKKIQLKLAREFYQDKRLREIEEEKIQKETEQKNQLTISTINTAKFESYTKYLPNLDQYLVNYKEELSKTSSKLKDSLTKNKNKKLQYYKSFKLFNKNYYVVKKGKGLKMLKVSSLPLVIYNKQLYLPIKGKYNLYNKQINKNNLNQPLLIDINSSYTFNNSITTPPPSKSTSSTISSTSLLKCPTKIIFDDNLWEESNKFHPYIPYSNEVDLKITEELEKKTSSKKSTNPSISASVSVPTPSSSTSSAPPSSGTVDFTLDPEDNFVMPNENKPKPKRMGFGTLLSENIDEEKEKNLIKKMKITLQEHSLSSCGCESSKEFSGSINEYDNDFDTVPIGFGEGDEIMCVTEKELEEENLKSQSELALSIALSIIKQGEEKKKIQQEKLLEEINEKREKKQQEKILRKQQEIEEKEREAAAAAAAGSSSNYANIEKLTSIFIKDTGVWMKDDGNLEHRGLGQGDEDTLFKFAETMGRDIRSDANSLLKSSGTENQKCENNSLFFNFFEDNPVDNKTQGEIYKEDELEVNFCYDDVVTSAKKFCRDK